LAFHYLIQTPDFGNPRYGNFLSGNPTGKHRGLPTQGKKFEDTHIGYAYIYAYPMRIPYGRVQGSGDNACTGKYCIICPGGTKKKKKKHIAHTSNAWSTSTFIVMPDLVTHNMRLSELPSFGHKTQK
jgi:hypothetical protein